VVGHSMSERRRAHWARSPKTYLFAAGVGFIGGGIATAFQVGSRALQRSLMGGGTMLDAAKQLAWWQCILIPLSGAVVASFLKFGLTRKRSSQGMVDVMEAVTLKKARNLSVLATVKRATASFFVVATGGSLGREGPIAYMAASFGARFAKLVRVPEQHRGLFAGCGIAAGMSASYFAPLGAALFAMEIVLGNFAAEIFAPVVIASIISSLVVNGFAAGPFEGFISGAPLYDLPPFSMSHPGEILLFVVVGCLAAGGGWLFINSLRESERLFRRIEIPQLLKLPLGGLLIGVIGIWMPQVWGNGYDACNVVLKEHPEFGFVALLFVMKIVATALTIGSGASGGIFTPTLFVGVALGVMVGEMGHALFPSYVLDSRPYAVVGMGAAVAATTQAPIMAIFLLFEMTRSTEVVLPLMVATMSASVTARVLGMESIYVAGLKRKGVRVPEGIEETALTTMRVENLMREDHVAIRRRTQFDAIVKTFQKTRRDFVYVINPEGHLHGMIRLHDIKNYLATTELGPAVIAADITSDVPLTYPDQSVAEIMPLFDDPELHELPVIDRESRRLVGFLNRRDLITALSVEVLQTRNLRAKFVEHQGAEHYVEIPPGHKLARIPVPGALAGKTLSEADLRRQRGIHVLTIVQTQQGREVRVHPTPQSLLVAEDELIVMGPHDAVELLERAADSDRE